jgi:hypothetical protein
MPVLKPPKPGGTGSKTADNTWTLILKPGESVDVQQEK